LDEKSSANKGSHLDESKFTSSLVFNIITLLSPN